MNSSKICYLFLVLVFSIHNSKALPLLSYFSSDSVYDGTSDDGEQTSTALAEVSSDQDSSLIRYDTVVPVLRVVLTPIGRILQPMIERWIAERFGPYIDSISRSLEGLSRFATDNVSFQTGDTYYTKSDLVDGYGYNSLIINLPSGKSVTVLTHKSNRKLNILDEFPQLSEALNEVRKLQ